jgi:hypothetical protein
VIGIGRYKDPRIPTLRYADKDAEEFYDVLVDPKRGRFNPANVRKLIGPQATRLEIQRIIGKWLTKQVANSPEATAIIFFCGHGECEADFRGKEPDGYAKYLLPVDTDSEDLRFTALGSADFTDLLAGVNAKGLVIFLDACFAGAVAEGATARGDLPDSVDISNDIQKRLEGTVPSKSEPAQATTVIIAAARSTERSYEIDSLEHGNFTYHLIEALSGKADFNKDGYIHVRDVYEYLETNVPKTAEDLCQAWQKPVMNLPVAEAPNFLLAEDVSRLKEINLRERQAALKSLFKSDELSDQEYFEASKILEKRSPGRSYGALIRLLNKEYTVKTYRDILREEAGSETIVEQQAPTLVQEPPPPDRIPWYKRLRWRYRYILPIFFALIAFWVGQMVVRQVWPVDFGKLPEGALVSDATTRKWLGIQDMGWFCEEPHYKGKLLHLRHQVFQPKDVIVFLHGFTGDYVNTWGKLSVLLDDPRTNRNYDFVFYGCKAALFGDVPTFNDEAVKLGRALDRLEENYRSITLVTHSKGSLLAMRTLLNRAKDFPTVQSYRIHRVVMFAPLTENVSLAQDPELVKLIDAQSKVTPPIVPASWNVAYMQTNTYFELAKVKEDLKAVLDPKDPIGETRKDHFLKDVAEHLYVINVEHDEIVDAGPNGEKIVSEEIRKLCELPSLDSPRLVTLRYKDIGGSEEDARVKQSGGARNPAYAHSIVVKMGAQSNFSFFDHFEELLYDRIGIPPRQFPH